MQQYDYDLFTIGAGSGGVAASRRAGSHGAKVAICEEDRVGGTCVLRGCVPKKLLVYGAHYREDFEDAAGYGWEIEKASLNWARLVEAKNKELSRLNEIYMRMLHGSGVELIPGRGRIVDAHRVQVGDRIYSARYILVCTGSRPVMPSIPGVELGITSNEALELKELPRRIMILGGGYIALEFAGIFNAAGSEVTLLVRGDNILRGFDADIRFNLAEELRKKGIKILTDTQVLCLERGPESIQVLTQSEEMLEADCVLFATGRAPNVEALGLEQAGVKLNRGGGIKVDEWSRSSVPSIYAIGDVTDNEMLTPVAIAEGRAMAETLFNKSPTQVDRRDIPTAIFSMPPVGTVGLSEAQARSIYGRVDVYATGFRPMKYTLSGRDERTHMKLVVERLSGRVLGCHMVGMDAPEIVQSLAVSIKAGATKAQFDATMALHPTAAEEFVTLYSRVPDPSERSEQ